MPFLLIGFTFFILSFSAEQVAYLPIGLAFIAIGAGQLYRKKKSYSDEQESEADNS